jgi:hypothetical protein
LGFRIHRQKNNKTLEYLNFQARKKQLMEEWNNAVMKPKRVFRERRVRAEDRRGRWKDKLEA